MPQSATVSHRGHLLSTPADRSMLALLSVLCLAACGEPEEPDMAMTPLASTPSAPSSTLPMGMGGTPAGPGGGGMPVVGPSGGTPAGGMPADPGGGGGGGGGMAAGGMGGGDAPIRSTTGPSYAATVEPIFSEVCTPSCHEPGGLLGGPGGLGQDGVFMDLSAGAGYAALTAEPSKQLPTMWIVGATLDESYLWHKIQDTYEAIGGKGAKMPVTGELTEADIAVVQAWIEGGATP